MVEKLSSFSKEDVSELANKLNYLTIPYNTNLVYREWAILCYNGRYYTDTNHQYCLQQILGKEKINLEKMSVEECKELERDSGFCALNVWSNLCDREENAITIQSLEYNLDIVDLDLLKQIWRDFGKCYIGYQRTIKDNNPFLTKDFKEFRKEIKRLQGE